LIVNNREKKNLSKFHVERLKTQQFEGNIYVALKDGPYRLDASCQHLIYTVRPFWMEHMMRWMTLLLKLVPIP
jgi:hypothetical protein